MCLAGGVEALLVVAGMGAEPVLAAAAMQALTALVGSAKARTLLLQHPGFLDALLSSMQTGTPPHGCATAPCHLLLLLISAITGANDQVRSKVGCPDSCEWRRETSTGFCCRQEHAGSCGSWP